MLLVPPGTDTMVPLYCTQAMRRMRVLQVRQVLDVRQNSKAYADWLRQKRRLCRICTGSGGGTQHQRIQDTRCAELRGGGTYRTALGRISLGDDGRAAAP